jgi:hypothetical protein
MDRMIGKDFEAGLANLKAVDGMMQHDEEPAERGISGLYEHMETRGGTLWTKTSIR